MKKTAAFFDLDGTLIKGLSFEERFLLYLLKKREIGIIGISRIFKGIFNNLNDGISLALRKSKYYLKHKNIKQIETLAKDFTEKYSENLISSKMKNLIDKHREKEELVFLISGTPYFILQNIVKKFKFDGGKGTELEKKDGLFTGKIIGIHPYGIGKLKILNTFIKNYNINKDKSTAYADHYQDRYFLEGVSNSVAVNPGLKLKKYMKDKNWNTVYF